MRFDDLPAFRQKIKILIAGERTKPKARGYFFPDPYIVRHLKRLEDYVWA
jgi:hypothetical protein